MKFKLLHLFLFAIAAIFCNGQTPWNESISNTLSDIPSDVLYQHKWDHLDITYYSLVDSLIPSIIKLDLLSPSCLPFFYPVLAENKVISRYGKRGSRIHYGTDLKLNLGDTIYAAFDGKVRLTHNYSGYGKMIGLRHYNGLETIYGHVSVILVKTNQDVKAGDPIGLGGRTGRATCNHLHFEARLLGHPFNLEKIINFEKKELIANVVIYDKKKKSFSYQMNIREAMTVPMPMLQSKLDIRVKVE